MEVTLQADRVEWHQGVASAEGAVRVTWDGNWIVAERGTYADGVITLENGTWSRGVEFDRAVVELEGTGVVEGLRVVSGGATLTAAKATIGERWTIEEGYVEPCACPDGKPPALTFRARSAEVVPERVVILHGGTVRVFDLPVLPVPYWRVGLDRDRFRLLFPEVGWGELGVNASWEGQGTVDGWTLRGGPAFRQDRGFRAVGSVKGPWALGAAEGGWDWTEDRLRGAVDTRGGRDDRVRFAWDASVQSDREYADDYALDYVARGVAWREARGVVEWGPLRALGWWPDDGSDGQHAQLRVRVPLLDGRLAPRVAVGLDPDPVGHVGLDGGASGTLGWLHGEVRGDVAADLEGVAGRGDARVEVPFWTSPPRAQWWVGAHGRVDTGVVEGELVRGIDAPPLLVAGPSARVEVVGGDAVVTVDATAGWTLDRAWPMGVVSVRTGPVQATVRADPRLQVGDLKGVAGPLTLAVGSARLDADQAPGDGEYAGTDVWLAWTDAAVSAGRLRVGGGVTWDLGLERYAGASGRVGYDDGCTHATIHAGFAPDRAIPDLSLTVGVKR